MATMEDRMRALEERVTRLEVAGQHTAEVADASLEANRHDVTLLNALRETQLEQGAMLTDHTRRLDTLAADMDVVKKDVESIKGSIGKITVGMYTLENLIRQIVPDETVS